MSDSESEQQTLDNSTMTWQEFLIECVRARPCLYDKYDVIFSDTRGVKANAWGEIVGELIAAGFTTIKNKPTSEYT